MPRDAASRAADLVLNGPDEPVVALRLGVFSVASRRGGILRYTVDLRSTRPSCSCPRFRYLAGDPDATADPTCKHVEAVRIRQRLLYRPLEVGAPAST